MTTKETSVKKYRRPWGAHMSIAGGVSNAIGRGASVGASAIQIFTKNNNQWQGKPLTGEEIDKFSVLRDELGVDIPASHDCYLINLASPDPALAKKSYDAFLDEIDRADALGVPNLVFHPGAHMGEGEEAGIERVVKNLDAAAEARPKALVTFAIETTAGQGSSLGYRFEQIAAIIGQSKYPERFGVCVDTCHIFAAGYDISTKKGFLATFKEFDQLVGIDKIKLFHVNDSKRELGSRVDRHAHIGKGEIGPEGFRALVNDRRFKKVPMILETPKGADLAEDIENLAVLDSLVKR